MRWHLGPIPDEFTPDCSWRPIREPGPAVMQLFAVPIGIVAFLAVFAGWRQFGVSPSITIHGLSEAVLFLVGLLISFPLLFLVHELLHAVVHPAAAVRLQQ
jgi:hypothetical protein